MAYSGFVPWWPGVTGSPRQAELDDLISKDKRDARRNLLREGKGAYWQGKGLQRTLKLMDVVEQQGDSAGRDQLLEMSKSGFIWLRAAKQMAVHPSEIRNAVSRRQPAPSAARDIIRVARSGASDFMMNVAICAVAGAPIGWSLARFGSPITCR